MATLEFLAKYLCIRKKATIATAYLALSRNLTYQVILKQQSSKAQGKNNLAQKKGTQPLSSV
jgi:hypothetical protein